MKVFCILSDERAFRSKSPVMHTAVLQRAGIDGVYVPFMVSPDRVGEAVRGLRALHVSGANVTVPHKEAVMPFLDVLSDAAASIGAVNTIVFSGEELHGHNTDAPGFLDVLDKSGFDPANKSVIVFGTGGAAKAVLFALGRAGARPVTVAGRDERRTGELAARFNAEPVVLESLPGRSVEAELVVNATAVSTPAESPELAELLGRIDVAGCEFVVDLNYARSENFWKDLAATRGARFVDGLPMLAHQARRSFRLWTGIEIDVRHFEEALRENL
jgi:shikimate dehydrogenase